MPSLNPPNPPSPEHRRSIPDPGFAGDDGSTPAHLAAALTAYEAGAAGHLQTLSVLAGCRLLVPVVAVLGEVEVDEHGLAHDKSSDMATVLLTGRDGRQALLAFTGLDALQRWRADARPVPIAADLAATSAIAEGADALVVDVAGPVRFVVAGDDLQGLARRWRIGRVGSGEDAEYAWIGAGGE